MTFPCKNMKLIFYTHSCYYRKTDIHINNTCNLIQYLYKIMNYSLVIVEFNVTQFSFLDKI